MYDDFSRFSEVTLEICKWKDRRSAGYPDAPVMSPNSLQLIYSLQ